MLVIQVFCQISCQLCYKTQIRILLYVLCWLKWIYQAQTKRYQKQNRTYLLGHPLVVTKWTSTVVTKWMSTVGLKLMSSVAVVTKWAFTVVTKSSLSIFWALFLQDEAFCWVHQPLNLVTWVHSVTQMQKKINSIVLELFKLWQNEQKSHLFFYLELLSYTKLSTVQWLQN